MCVCVIHMEVRGQLWSHFFSFTLMWVPGIELRASWHNFLMLVYDLESCGSTPETATAGYESSHRCPCMSELACCQLVPALTSCVAQNRISLTSGYQLTAQSVSSSSIRRKRFPFILYSKAYGSHFPTAWDWMKTLSLSLDLARHILTFYELEFYDFICI